MAWWIWIAVVWVSLGVILLIAEEKMARNDSAKNEASIYESMMIVAGAPVFLLAIFWKDLKSPREKPSARIPVQASETLPYERDLSRVFMICRMIELRRKHDPQLRNREPPTGWPMFRILATPEAMIVDAVEDYYWLRDGGMTEREALERMEKFRIGSNKVDLLDCDSFHTYVWCAVIVTAPIWSKIDIAIFDEALAIARRWHAEDIEHERVNPSDPSVASLGGRIGVALAESGKILTDDGKEMQAMSVNDVSYSLNASVPARRQEWARMRLRMLPGDELTWFGRGGPSYGVALVRQGRPIAHFVTAHICR